LDKREYPKGEGVQMNTQAKHSTPPSSTANAVESSSSSKRRSKKNNTLPLG